MQVAAGDFTLGLFDDLATDLAHPEPRHDDEGEQEHDPEQHEFLPDFEILHVSVCIRIS